MFRKEKAKGSPVQRYYLWLFLGLCIGTLAVVSFFIALFEPRRDMHFAEKSKIYHDEYVQFGAFSPDNQHIFSYNYMDFRVSDLAGNQVSLFEEESVNYYDMRWNPQQSYFLVNNYQQSALLFDSTGNLITVYQHPGIHDSYWNPTGNRIVTLSDNEARIWSVDGQLMKSLDRNFRYGGIFQWSPDGNRLVLWWNANEGAVFDADGNEVQRLELAGYPGAFAWNSSNSAFAIAQHLPESSYRQRVSVYNPEGELLWSEEVAIEDTSLLWSPDGSRLAILNLYNEQANLWTLEGEHLKTIENGSFFQWHPDSEILLMGSSDGMTLQFLDKNGELLHELPQGGTYGSIPQWSPDGEILASWTNRLEVGYASLLLWDKNGNLLHELRESSPIDFVYWSPDSSRILSVGGFVAHLWSVAEGGEINSLQHSQPIYHARWSGDASRILTIGSYGSNTVENAVWTGEGEHITTLFTGDSNQTYALDWHDDLNQVLIQQYSTVLSIYNLEPGAIYFDFRLDNR